MRYGSAMVERWIDGRTRVIRVRVSVEYPTDPRRSYIRYGPGLSKSPISSGAYSGARFARSKIDRDHYGITILEISGDLNSPRASDGAAVASVVATWVAYGADWQDADLLDTYGWSVHRRPGT
jgi:hypothetical protein